MGERVGKIILKKDWDEPVRFDPVNGKTLGRFRGRQSEIDWLANEIAHKKSGTILICGHRGVGKSSLVYEAIAKVLDKKTENKKKNTNNIIPVFLNAVQLVEYRLRNNDKVEFDPKATLVNLIRGLWSACRSRRWNGIGGAKSEIEELYKKAVAADFQLQEIVRAGMKESEERETGSYQILGAEIGGVAYVIGFLIAAYLIIVRPWAFPVSELIGLLCSYPLPRLVDIGIRHWAREKHTSEKWAGAKTKQIYVHDNSLLSLHFGLEEVHRKLTREQAKVVYVVDELDKLDGGEANPTKELLSYFKNLFTLSNALFIFVGSEKSYDLGLEAQRGRASDFRPAAYTYYSSRYFIPRATFEDISKYIDDIVEEKQDVSDKEMEMLKRVVGFGARNDFFDLRREIRDLIMFEEGVPVIDTSNFGNHEEEIAKMHKAVVLILEEKYLSKKPSAWKENEMLCRDIWKHAHTIIETGPGFTCEDPKGAGIEESMIRDFNALMVRLGAFRVDKKQQIQIGASSVTVGVYTYLGRIQLDPPSRLDEPTEYERGFIASYEEFSDYIVTVRDMCAKAMGEYYPQRRGRRNRVAAVQEAVQWLKRNGMIDMVSRIHPVTSIYEQLVYARPPGAVSRDEVTQGSTEIERLKQVVTSALPSILAVTVAKKYDLGIGQLQQKPNFFAGDMMPVRRRLANNNPPVVFRDNPMRQIMFVKDQADLLNEFWKELRENRNTHRIVLVLPAPERRRIGFHVVVYRDRSNLKSSFENTIRALGRFIKQV